MQSGRIRFKAMMNMDRLIMIASIRLTRTIALLLAITLCARARAQQVFVANTRNNSHPTAAIRFNFFPPPICDAAKCQIGKVLRLHRVSASGTKFPVDS